MPRLLILSACASPGRELQRGSPVMRRMFHDCARIITELDAGSRNQGVVVLQVRKDREQIQRAAKDFVREACAGTPATDAQRHLLDGMRAALSSLFEESE